MSQMEAETSGVGSPGMSPATRSIVMAAIALALLALIVFASNYRTEQVRRAELARNVDAMSEALEPTLLTADRDKIGRVLQDIARAGDYVAVTYADNRGTVVASTDAMKRGIKSEALRKAPIKAEVKSEKGRIIVRRAIILAGDTRFGNLEIIAD